MTASRTQHLVASTAVLVVALSVGWLSFTQEPVEAFLFPRLIAVAFMVLAVWNFARAALGLAKVGEGLNLRQTINLAPGLVLALVYVYFAARWLGFYASSSLAFLLVYTLYDPALITDIRGWARRILVTVCFMTVIYGLFSLLLKVQTPRGLFF